MDGEEPGDARGHPRVRGEQGQLSTSPLSGRQGAGGLLWRTD